MSVVRSTPEQLHLRLRAQGFDVPLLVIRTWGMSSPNRGYHVDRWLRKQEGRPYQRGAPFPQFIAAFARHIRRNLALSARERGEVELSV